MDNESTLVVFDIGNVVGGVDLPGGASDLAGVLNVDVGTLVAGCEAIRLWQRYETGVLSTADVLDFLRSEFSASTTADRDLVRAIEAVVLPQFPETLDLVERLSAAGYNLAVLSNTNPIHWEKVLHDYEALCHVNVLGASHELGHAKPNSEIYSALVRLATMAGITVRNVIFFDDIPEYVEGATKCGWHATQFVDAAQAERVLAEYGLIF